MPTFSDYYQAMSLKDASERELALSLLEMKRTRLAIQCQTRKSRMVALQAEWRRNEEKEARDRAWGAQQNARTQEMQAQMRQGVLSARNSQRW